ncbi:MAG: pilus assembly protein PilM [Deltaproteobacteria bacterium]|nr:pilus assembly protein PilM [Deltaproteobacteria bacterium]MBW2165520.1 pilus assembly protein PilM [Deltaproteobacteria bacterium]
MFKLGSPKILTGLDITRTSVKVAQIEKLKNGWKLLRYGSIPIPENTIKLSYKSKNIINIELFHQTIRKSMELLAGEVSIAGLSIPNEIVKSSIHKYGELPKSKAEIGKMVEWGVGKLLPFHVKNMKISYHIIGKNQAGESALFVTIGIQDVINEYELSLKELKIDAKIIRPSGVSQLNFYINKLPKTACVAYIGLFDNFFTLFIFDDAQLIYYCGVKKGFSDIHFFHNIDMAMQHYLNKNPDKQIEKFFIASQVGDHQELEDVLDVMRSIINKDIHIIDEKQIIEEDISHSEVKGLKNLSSYTSAIGAAQSLE